MLDNKVVLAQSAKDEVVLTVQLLKKLWTKAQRTNQVLVFNVFRRKNGDTTSINSIVLRPKLKERQSFLNGSTAWFFRAPKRTRDGEKYITGCIAPFKLPSTIRQNAQGIQITILLEKTSEQAYEGSENKVVEVQQSKSFIN